MTTQTHTSPTEVAKFFSSWRGFAPATLPSEAKTRLTEMARQARGSILKMTTVAASGHPGGSMSSLETYLLLYNFARLRPESPHWEERDRIVISHGHTSPGVYAALGHSGFFNVADTHYGFRLGGSPFEGHVERSVPGVEWDTGNLGQGLSAGCGMAIAARVNGQKITSFVVMGDGEQQKGQISEARRFAVKFGLSNLVAIIDYNQLQLSGSLTKIMPQNIVDNWRSDGWQVMEAKGHDWDDMYRCLREAAHNTGAPIMILAHTIMGKGYPPIENDYNYHGAALKVDQCRDAFKVLGLTEPGYDDLDALAARRKQGPPAAFSHAPHHYPRISLGTPRTYQPSEKTDNRSAWGNALVDLGAANNLGASGATGASGAAPIAVFDCDLLKSVKTADFGAKFPASYFQSGIAEHSTATTAGACSANGVVTFWSDFGVFGVCETYNQNRLNDINDANLKVVCTHSGIDVGEDGKTHQCIDYFALSRSVFGWKLFTPADPNQTDRIIRYVAGVPGNFLVIMGRSVMAPFANSEGGALFGDRYEYCPGRTDLIRDGEGVTIFCAGNTARLGMAAWEELRTEGITARLISTAQWCDFHPDDLRQAAEFGKIITVEDHNVNTGLGMSLSAELFAAGLGAHLWKLGATQYASSGKPDDLYRMMGMDGAAIAKAARAILSQSSAQHARAAVGV